MPARTATRPIWVQNPARERCVASVVIPTLKRSSPPKRDFRAQPRFDSIEEWERNGEEHKVWLQFSLPAGETLSVFERGRFSGKPHPMCVAYDRKKKNTLRRKPKPSKFALSLVENYKANKTLAMLKAAEAKEAHRRRQIA